MEKNTMKYIGRAALTITYEVTHELMQEIRDAYDTNFPSEEQVLAFLKDRFIGNGTYDTNGILTHGYEWA
jgi:hypothetical protein